MLDISVLRRWGSRPALVSEKVELSYESLADAIENLKLQPLKNTPFVLEGEQGIASCIAFLAAIFRAYTFMPCLNRSEDEINDLQRTVSVFSKLECSDTLQNWDFTLTKIPPGADSFSSHSIPTQNTLLLTTSGTTGKPKLLQHSIKALLKRYPVRTTQSSFQKILLFMHLDHIGGIDVFLRGLAGGHTLFIPPDRNPVTISVWLSHYRITVFPTTPSFLQWMLAGGELENPSKFEELKIVPFGAEFMPPKLYRKLQERLPNVHFLQRYGTTETGPVGIETENDQSLRFRIKDDQVQSRLVEGELWLKSASQAVSDKTPKDSWFKTGDLFEEAENGFMLWIGRKDLRINVGGEKVNPEKVESKLSELESIIAIRVKGSPHPLLGQVVEADIVPDPDASPEAIRKEIREFSRKHLARHELPVKINFVNHIPIGKNLKRCT